jgi:hypothetical protein
MNVGQFLEKWGRTMFERALGRAVGRTTEVVAWLLFLLVWWFGSALYEFLRTLTKTPAAKLTHPPSVPCGAITGVDPRLSADSGLIGD